MWFFGIVTAETILQTVWTVTTWPFVTTWPTWPFASCVSLWHKIVKGLHTIFRKVEENTKGTPQWCDPMYPLQCAPTVPYVPVRITRHALVAHHFTYESLRCRTSQYPRSFILFARGRWMMFHFSIVQSPLYFLLIKFNCTFFHYKILPNYVYYYCIWFGCELVIGCMYFFFFRVRFVSVYTDASRLTFFYFVVLFHYCCSHERVFLKTLVHEFNISYSHTEWYLFFSDSATASAQCVFGVIK